MPDLLPDIPSDVYNQWASNQFTQAVQDKISSLPGDIWQGAQSAVAQVVPPPEAAPPPPPPPPEPPPPPPPPAPEVAPPPVDQGLPGVDTTTPVPTDTTPAPTDTSAPTPDLSQPAPDQTAPTPAPTPTPDQTQPAPTPAPTPTPTPTPQPSSGGQGFDPFNAALNAADAAGANVQQFASSFNQNLGRTGGDLMLAGINAASQAGGDVQKFMDQYGGAFPQVQQAAQGAAQQATGAAQGAAQSLSGAIDSSSPAAFAKSFAPYAQQAAQELGIDPTWVAAMAGSESNYGNAPGNELFGIKALPGQPGTSLQTHEGEYGGTNVNQTFASYNTPQDSVNAFVDLLKNHYPGAVGAQTLQDFVHGLKQGGYFTAAEPEYLGILQGISNKIGGDVQSGLSSAQSGLQNAGQTAVNTVQDATQSAVARTSQFAMGLSSGDAMAFCGPAAAMAFAQTFGRNPTVDEAKQLAQQVGWNASQGMAGPSSEVALLNKLGIDTHMSQGVDWNTVASEAQSGNPVIIDTPGHYFYVDGYNADTGQLHLGTSATDLKAANGQSWFTPDQIPSLGMGTPQAAIYADHPLSASSSVATNSPQSQSIQSGLTMGGNQSVSQQAQDTLDAVLTTGQDATQSASDWLDQQKAMLSDKLSNAGSAVGQTAQDIGQSAQDLLSSAATSGAGQDVLQNILGPLLGLPPSGAAQTTSSVLPSDLNNLSPSDLLDLGRTPQGQDILNALSAAASSGAGTPFGLGGLLGLPTATDVLSGGATTATNPSGTAQDVLNSLSDLSSSGAAQDLSALGQDAWQGLGAAADVIEQQRQADIAQQANFGNALLGDTSTMQDVGSNIQALLNANPMTSSQSDLSPSVSAGLTAAGVDPTVARVLGQVANVVAPAALEGGGARALTDLLTQAPGAALGGGLGLMDLLRSPEIAYASTSRALDQGGQLERLLNEGGQVLGTQGAPMSSIYQRASGTDMLAQALSSLQSLPEEAQTRLLTQAQDLADAGQQPASTVASRLQQWIAQETAPSALGQALQAEAAARAAPGAAEATAAPAATTAQDLISRLAALRQQVENAPLTASEELAKLGTPAAETAATPAERTLTPNQAAQIADDIARGYTSPIDEAGAAGGGVGGKPPTGAGGTPPPTGAPPLQTGAVTTLQGSNLFDTLGRYIASALSPGDNLKPEVQSALQPFANLVGDAHGIDLLVNRDIQQYGLSGALGAEDGPGQNLLRTQYYNEATNRLIGDLRAQGLITPLTNRSIPKGWQAATTGNGQLANYRVHPDVAGPLRAIVDHTGFLTTNPLGRAVRNTWGTVKQTIFTLSQMHTLTTALNAAFSSPETLGNMLHAFASPSFYEGMRNGKLADTFVNAAVKGGVTGLAPRAEATDVGYQLKNPLARRVIQSGVGGVGGGASSYLAAKQAGLSDDQARNAAIAGGVAGTALGPTVAPKLTQALWNRAMPMAKATAWQALVNGGMDAQAAGRVINQRFGGLNYAAMGRSPAVQDALRVGIQAPDWLEAPIRQAGNLIGGAGAGETRAFLAKTMGGMAIATELTNHALTGHWTDQNQPGYQFMVEQKDPAGGYMHFGLYPPQYQTYINLANKIVANPSRAGADVLNWGTARLPAPIAAASNLIQTAAAGTNTGKLPYGVAKAGPWAAALSQFAPVGVSQVAEGTQQGGEDLLGTIAMALAGLNPTYSGGSSSAGGAPASHLPAASSTTRTTVRTPPAPKTARTR